ncbi:hypothetical protein [Pseudomonas sp. EMN2]|uniref:hypothetical protein n=1 Tax=Pseudomonas sp. EMN2 TaxID=2615212 RepID=UPI00129B3A73|nr:hypothetical protein [Pseudomonas sp. EMN2]
MAHDHDDLTKATGITADVVMEAGTYSSAKDMRSLQTGLTSAARELRAFTQRNTLRGRLGEMLSLEQRELLTNAAALLDSIKYNVEHAKERKERTEKATAKKRKQWEQEAMQLVKAHFTLPAETVAEQLRILELHLVAQVVLGQTTYMADHLQLRRKMQEVPPQWSNVTVAQWRRSEVTSLLGDCQSALRYYLSWDLKKLPAQQLEEVQRSLEERRAEILAKPASVETIRIWSDALKGAAFIYSVMPPIGSSN